MTSNELDILTYITRIINSVSNDDIAAASKIVEEINEKNYDMVELGSIGDAIYEDMHNKCTETHLYFLKNINNLPDRDSAIRIANALVAFNFNKNDARNFLESVIDENYIMSGHKTDFYYCSILIRLCLSIQAFDLIDTIQDMLKNKKVSEEV